MLRNFRKPYFLNGSFSCINVGIVTSLLTILKSEKNDILLSTSKKQKVHLKIKLR
jgi:hypothetical protein